MEFIFKLTQKTYKYYYDTNTGDIVAKINQRASIGIDNPYFTSTETIDIFTHRYNTETGEVEPKE
jgi:hypothetical protein